MAHVDDLFERRTQQVLLPIVPWSCHRAPRAENPAPENHDPRKIGIPNCKKTQVPTSLSCDYGYFSPPTHPRRSATSAFFTELVPNSQVVDTGSRGIYGKTPLAEEDDRLVPAALENSGVMAIGAPGHAFFFTTMRFNQEPQEVFARLVPDQCPPINNDYVMWAILLPQREVSDDVDQQDPGRLHLLAVETSRNYHPILRRLVERARVNFTVGTKICAATKRRSWTNVRATLMGDAIHAMPPTGAHGGNTALRDAALLAAKFLDVAEADKPLDQALKEFQQEMPVYAFKEVQRSLMMLRRIDIHNQVVRFAPLQAMPWLRATTGSSLVS